MVSEGLVEGVEGDIEGGDSVDVVGDLDLEVGVHDDWVNKVIGVGG